MGWSTYIDGVRLNARNWYFLQRVDDELAADHPVLRSPSGALLFPSEADAHSAALELEEPLTPKEPYIADLDAVLAWAAKPTSASLDYWRLMTSWHVLVDLGALASPEDAMGDSVSPLEDIVDKLHLGLTYDGELARPEHAVAWTDVELALAARALREGIERLRVSLPEPRPGEVAPPAV
jgi:hypothetical protein